MALSITVKRTRKKPAAAPQPAAKPQKSSREYNEEIACIERERGAQEALALAQQALAVYPHNFALNNNTGVMLMRCQRYHEAIAQFQRIPDYEQHAVVLGNIGTCYRRLNQFAAAVEWLEKALALEPDNLSNLQTLGATQVNLGNYREAVGYFERILAAKPQDAMTAFNLGTAYQKLHELAQAERWYRHAMQLDPKYKDALGNWAFIQNYIVPYDAERIARETFAYAAACVKATNIKLPPVATSQPEKKLHIGLVTADLKATHPVGYFLEGLLTGDAMRQFDWSAYLNNSVEDRLTRAVKPRFKHWHGIQAWSDAKVREQIRSDGIDILIDLSGYTGGNRAGVFFAQTAPVQLEWLGWFATTGLPHMNGIIADPYCVPSEEEHLYSETVWRLPHTRLCMQPPREEAEVLSPPVLANGYISFGCYQNPLKISDEVLATWAKIAAKLPSAHWHFKGGAVAEGKPAHTLLLQKLTGLGFKPAQLHFSGRSARQEYLKSYNDLDIILDTFPYPGGTTTADALWMGVPTITLALLGMIARQGEQLMSAAGYPELVCRSQEEYIEKALYWADEKNREKLTALRAGMRDKVRRSPVFDTAQFSEDWCNLMRDIWRDACAKAV